MELLLAGASLISWYIFQTFSQLPTFSQRLLYQSERLDATRIDFLIAENVQQKANMTIISHEICKDKWGDTLGPLIAGQGMSVLNIDSFIKSYIYTYL